MIAPALPSKQTNRSANRRLYDSVAERYERIDGRRNSDLERWIRDELKRLAERHGNGVLLDLGTGGGVVIRAGAGVFRRSIALDLSPRMLETLSSTTADRVVADVDALPIRDGSIDVVTCFAVLHHLPDSMRLAREAARVLRPGGVFWSDHDIEREFCRRFRWPLGVYRRMRAARSRYSESVEASAHDDYADAECRENGVDARETVRDFTDAGLSARAQYHWYGLGPATNRLFSRRTHSRGWAPLLRLTAVKP